MFKKYKISSHLDDPNTTLQHREIILNKKCLKDIYLDWYKEFIEFYKIHPHEKHLEIGSGGGFLKDIFPDVITSDIMMLPHVDMKIDAEELPFEDNSLMSVSMVNVFHHIPRPQKFLKEAERCLKKGGRVMMIEPANTFFSRFIYKNFHHEPFDENGPMEIKPGNPLSNSNQAMAYIYFVREKDMLDKDFPSLELLKYKNFMPFRYVLSGGVSRSAILPDIGFGLLKKIEKIEFINKHFGLFTKVILQKK